jgi:hypothetical protein
MVQDIPGCDVGCFSNKTARVTTVSRLNAMGVPAEIGMKLTGHNSREGYMRYNTDEDGIEMRVSKPVSHDPCGFWRISGDLDGVREIDPGKDPAWLVDGEDYLEVGDILGGEADVFEISEPAADANLVDVPEPTSDAALEYL